jgi:hypothetical protein
MLNQVPGRLGRKLTSPFELVYGVKPDAKTWFELFSAGYFPVEKMAGESSSQTMDGNAVGRNDQSNTILFYSPMTKKYYTHLQCLSWTKVIYTSDALPPTYSIRWRLRLWTSPQSHRSCG